MPERPLLAAAALAVLVFAAAALPAPADALSVRRVVILSGSRTNGVVRLAVSTKRRELDACLRGSAAVVSVSLRIDPGGAVVDVSARGEGAARPVLECVERVARTLSLAASDAETRARIQISVVGLGGIPELDPTRPAPRPATINVRVPSPSSIEGWLRSDQVRRAILRNMAQLRHCYEVVHASVSADALPDGEVVVRVVVLPAGNAGSVSVVSSTFDREDVAACLAARLRGFRFPSLDDLPESSRPADPSIPTQFEQHILYTRPN